MNNFKMVSYNMNKFKRVSYKVYSFGSPSELLSINIYSSYDSVVEYLYDNDIKIFSVSKTISTTNVNNYLGHGINEDKNINEDVLKSLNILKRIKKIERILGE